MLRLGGLASGIDTDSMVKQMMKVENVKADRIKQDKQILEWRQQLYNEINKDFANFILKARKDFEYSEKGGRSQGGQWAIKATVSNDKVANIVAGKGAIQGSHSIEVRNLAEGVKGHSKVLKDDIDDINVAIEELKDGDITINGVALNLTGAKTIEDFVNRINNAKGKLLDENGNPVKDKNGKEVMVGTGIKANYDKASGRIFLQTTTIGSEAELKIEASNPNAINFMNALGLKVTHYTETTDANGKVVINKEESDLSLQSAGTFKGSNSLIEYNGVEITNKSNDFSLNGMDISLKEVGKLNANISPDNDEAIKRIKEFVEDYNKLIDKISGITNEKVNKNFRPLTDEQREAFSDKEAELWEEKAKSGLLRNDNYLNNMLLKVRQDIYKDVEGVNGKFKNITQIGITTQQYKAGSAGGKLEIDEEKLRKALNEDFDGVMDLLFKESKTDANSDDWKLDSSQLTKKRNESGIFTRIFDNMIVGMKDMIHKSGSGSSDVLFRTVKSTIMVDFAISGGKFSGQGSISDMDAELFKMDKRLDDLNAILYRRENAYYAKFAAMEKSMHKMNSQSDWLAQQFFR